MTLLAGIFNRTGALRLSAEHLANFRRAVSRNDSDAVLLVRDESAVLAKVDIGVFGSPAMLEDAEAVTMVAGEPILASAGPGADSRAADVAILHDALKREEYDRLRDARGTFSCAHYARASHRLVLATDKVGIRPIYWWTDDETVVFSSTLRLLESLAWVTKRPDLRGMAEQIAFGFALGSRTPYQGISLLRPGEVLECTATGVVSSEYWKWQDIHRSNEGLDTLTARAYDSFIDAVRLRQGGDRNATAFLSGGLDSRCVVAALRADDVAVHSFNFARPSSEDRVYGAELARAAGTVHEEKLMDDEIDVRWSSMIANARSGSTERIKTLVERPGLIWSGDGGSVGLGHVYIRPAIAQLCEAGDLEGAAGAYVAAERAILPKRLLNAEVASVMVAAPRTGVIEELTRLEMPELLQTFYLMLLHNDQHRHLFRHFEDIDLHRVELQLPFFDSAFLTVIASVPIEARLYHRFYNKWITRFPSYVANTYWQAYPGHEPCPIPKSHDLAYQWDPSFAAAKRRDARRKTVQVAVRTLLSSGFASGIMSRRTLAMAALVQLSGRREMEHIIYAARSIQQYWDASRRSAV